MSVQVEVILATVMKEQPVQILLVHICVHAKKVMKVMEGLAVFHQVMDDVSVDECFPPVIYVKIS